MPTSLVVLLKTRVNVAASSMEADSRETYCADEVVAHNASRCSNLGNYSTHFSTSFPADAPFLLFCHLNFHASSEDDKPGNLLSSRFDVSLAWMTLFSPNSNIESFLLSNPLRSSGQEEITRIYNAKSLGQKEGGKKKRLSTTDRSDFWQAQHISSSLDGALEFW